MEVKWTGYFQSESVTPMCTPILKTLILNGKDDLVFFVSFADIWRLSVCVLAGMAQIEATGPRVPYQTLDSSGEYFKANQN